MNGLMELRERLKNFYEDYDFVIRPVFRFVLALISLIALNNQIGYLEVLNQVFVVLILAVICAILPINGLVLICSVVIVAHSMALSVETGAFAIILYLLMVLLYFRFVPKDALAIILIPVAFVFHVDAAVPVALGLIRGPVSTVSMIFGLISWSYVQSLPADIAPLVNSDESSLLDVIQAMPRALFTTKMLLLLIVSVIVLLIVAMIRKLASSHSWEMSIAVGSILYVGLKIVGSLLLGVDIDILAEIFGTALSVGICLVIEFFNFCADYTRTEYLEFEDDHNYYNVRVTPKRTTEYMESLDRDATEDMSQIPSDDSRFMESEQQNEVSRKFEGINLQSKLEESLKTLNTNQSGKENGTGDTTTRIYRRSGSVSHRWDDLETGDDDEDRNTSGDTRVISPGRKNLK